MGRTFLALLLACAAAAPAEGGKLKRPYRPSAEAFKGAELAASSFDAAQRVEVPRWRTTVGGEAARADFAGAAAGKGAGIEGTMCLWLSIFRRVRPDGSVDHVAGWHLALPLRPGQTALETALAFAARINAGTRPYRAAAAGSAAKASLTVTYTGEENRTFKTAPK